MKPLEFFADSSMLKHLSEEAEETFILQFHTAVCIHIYTHIYGSYHTNQLLR